MIQASKGHAFYAKLKGILFGKRFCKTFPDRVPSQEPASAGAAVFSGYADAAVTVSHGDIVITVTNSASAELAALVIKEVLAHA